MDQYKEKGLVNTSLYCHSCSTDFIAQLDYDLDGNHEIECPRCGHKHCRVIKNGVVTGDRWDSREVTHPVPGRRMWVSQTIAAQTTTASHFLRSKWLNHGKG